MSTFRTSITIKDDARDFGLAGIKNATVNRGDFVKTDGGGVGHFVGVTKIGTTWVSYEDFNYKRMCARFDAMAEGSN